MKKSINIQFLHIKGIVALFPDDHKSLCGPGEISRKIKKKSYLLLIWQNHVFSRYYNLQPSSLSISAQGPFSKMLLHCQLWVLYSDFVIFPCLPRHVCGKWRWARSWDADHMPFHTRNFSFLSGSAYNCSLLISEIPGTLACFLSAPHPFGSVFRGSCPLPSTYSGISSFLWIW